MNFLGLRVTRSRSSDRATPAVLKNLTREAVVWAYRLFLDREPESEQVIEEHLLKCSSTRELRDNFIYSTEFRVNSPALHVPVLIGDEPAMSIEDRCSDDRLQKLFDHVQSTWQELGEIEPHWSVVIADQYCNRTYKTIKTSSTAPAHSTLRNCLPVWIETALTTVSSRVVWIMVAASVASRAISQSGLKR